MTHNREWVRGGLCWSSSSQVQYGPAYICVFVSLSIKAVHLEAVSDLTIHCPVVGVRHSFGVTTGPILLAPTESWKINHSMFRVHPYLLKHSSRSNAFRRRRCSERTISFVRGCFPWRMTGCILEYDNLELRSLPPTQSTSSESTKWMKRYQTAVGN